MQRIDEINLKDINDLLSKANKEINASKKDKSISFWLEMQPYLSVLGVSIPENPLGKLDLISLTKMVFSSKIFSKSSGVTQNLISIILQKAFSIHQMLGIMEKYEKISKEQCKLLRQKTFDFSSDLIETLNKKDNDKDKDKDKEQIYEFKFSESDEANFLDLKLKDSDKLEFDDKFKQNSGSLSLDTNLEHNSGSSSLDTIKKMSDLLSQEKINAYECLRLIHNISKLRKSLSNPNSFDHSKFDSYKRAMDEFVALKQDLTQLEQLAGSVITAGIRDEHLSSKLEKIGKDELPSGFLDKIFQASTNVLEKFSTQTDQVFSEIFKQLKQYRADFEQCKSLLEGCLENITKEQNINIESLTELYKKIDIKDRLKVLASSLKELKINISSESHTLTNLRKLFTEIKSLEEETSKLTDYQSKISGVLLKTIKKFQDLYSKIEHYKIKDVDSFMRRLGRQINAPAQGKTRAEKIEAAEKLQQVITTNSKETLLGVKAIREGQLGQLTKNYRTIMETMTSEVIESEEKYKRGLK
jgi:hypothetical protein